MTAAGAPRLRQGRARHPAADLARTAAPIFYAARRARLLLRGARVGGVVDGPLTRQRPLWSDRAASQPHCLPSRRVAEGDVLPVTVSGGGEVSLTRQRPPWSDRAAPRPHSLPLRRAAEADVLPGTVGERAALPRPPSALNLAGWLAKLLRPF